MTLAETVIAAQGGCHESFALLVKEHQSKLREIIWGSMRDKRWEDKEDMFQEVMLHAWRNIKSVKDPSKFYGWLNVLARWRCAAMRRIHPPPKQFEFQQDILFVMFMRKENFGDVILRREVVAGVMCAMKRLSKVDRNMLESEFCLEEIQEEQAKRLGVHKNTCSRKRKEARGNFRKAYLTCRNIRA